MFGIKADVDRQWLPNPDSNFLSWSFGFCVLSGFFSIFAGMCLLADYLRIGVETKREVREPAYSVKPNPRYWSFSCVDECFIWMDEWKSAGVIEDLHIKWNISNCMQFWFIVWVGVQKWSWFLQTRAFVCAYVYVCGKKALKDGLRSFREKVIQEKTFCFLSGREHCWKCSWMKGEGFVGNGGGEGGCRRAINEMQSIQCCFKKKMICCVGGRHICFVSPRI